MSIEFTIAAERGQAQWTAPAESKETEPSPNDLPCDDVWQALRAQIAAQGNGPCKK